MSPPAALAPTMPPTSALFTLPPPAHLRLGPPPAAERVQAALGGLAAALEELQSSVSAGEPRTGGRASD